MIKIKHKKAQGHIEMMISFSVFIVFLMLLFIIFNPLKRPVNPAVVESVYLKLNEELGTELQKAFISDNVVCASNTDIPSLEFFSGLDLCSSGGIKKSEGSGCFIYCSESGKINLDSSGTEQVLKENITYVNSKIMWSESDIDSFENAYCDDYDELKNKLGILTNDFAIKIYYSDYPKFKDIEKSASCLSPPPIPSNLEVYSRIYPIEWFDLDAKVTQGILQIYVW